jgi:hypothetical protein
MSLEELDIKNKKSDRDQLIMTHDPNLAIDKICRRVGVASPMENRIWFTEKDRVRSSNIENKVI